MTTIESLDRFAPIRNAMREAAQERKWWAGVPMPLDGEQLVVEPSYPFAEAFNRRPVEVDSPEDEGLRLRSRFWSTHRSSTILVIEDHGRITFGVEHGIHHFEQTLTTLGCACVWGIEQEAAAVATLATLLPHHAFKSYMLTGMFLERSERSGVAYCFRRLKPTVAMSFATGQSLILACLCLHPIAYYAGSWAGAMCPTDDVIAHLMLMRGDERMFWARANQHPAWVPEAGL